MIYSEAFLDDAAAVWSPKVRDHLARALAAVESFPEIGSTDVPASIRSQYGEGIRKIVVAPFDLAYEYDAEADAVLVYGLIHYRAAR